MLFSSVFKITTEIKLTVDIMVWTVSLKYLYIEALSTQDLRMWLCLKMDL